MNEKHMIAYEGLIQRSSKCHTYHPIILKGSFITRQYLPVTLERQPADLDWLSLKPLKDSTSMAKMLNTWLHQITQISLHDGVEFESFDLNHEWWELDYLLAEDFPTISTALKAKVDGQPTILKLDVSFNLQMSEPPVPLIYQPIRGHQFTLLQTPALSQQIAWKLHQTLLEPRLKDILDLTYLLQHEDYQYHEDALVMTLMTLEQDCQRDDIEMNSLFNRPFFADAEQHLKAEWSKAKDHLPVMNKQVIPQQFEVFWQNFVQAFLHSGLMQYQP